MLSSIVLILLSQALSASSRKTREYFWNITSFIDAPDGYSRYVVGINNEPCYNHPVIIDLGDTIKVTLQNSLNTSTGIHWHGILQEGTAIMDGATGITQCEILPGGSYVYEFTPSQAGTYWYHSHYRDQYVDGLRGAIVINDPHDPYANLYDAEQILILGDWYHNQSEVLAASFMDPNSYLQTNEPVWSSGLMNGHGQFDCEVGDRTPDYIGCSDRDPFVWNVKHGKTYRLRVINVSGFAAFNFSIANHAMQVIEADGVRTIPSQPITSFLLNVGQRINVLVKADQQIGTYLIVGDMPLNSPFTSLPESLVDPGFPGNVYAVMNYEEQDQIRSKIKQHPEFEYTEKMIVPLLVDVPEASTRAITFEFKFDIEDDDANYARISINNNTLQVPFKEPTIPTIFDVVYNKKTAADLPIDTNAIDLKYGEIIDFVIINYDGGEHPFHIHGHYFWLLAKGTAMSYSEIPTSFDLNSAIKRDTTTVPSCVTDDNGDCEGFGYSVLRIVAKNPGVWLFHCHIDWHMMMGLAVTLIESPEKIMLQKDLYPYGCSSEVLDNLHRSLIATEDSAAYTTVGLALIWALIQ